MPKNNVNIHIEEKNISYALRTVRKLKISVNAHQRQPVIRAWKDVFDYKINIEIHVFFFII